VILALSFLVVSLASPEPSSARDSDPERIKISLDENFQPRERLIQRSRLFSNKEVMLLSLFKDEQANSLLLYHANHPVNLDDELDLTFMKEKLVKTLANFKLAKTGRHKARGRHIRYFKLTGKRIVLYFFIFEQQGRVIFGELSCPESSGSDTVADSVMLSLKSH
jgi:hypothetical protein